MKKIIFFLFLALFTATGITTAKEKKNSAEVLYFKANLACCKAKACNSLESTVKSIVEKNWADGKVAFRQVKLSDSINSELIKKYNAKSQTLVVVVNKKKKETSADVSVLLEAFSSKHDTAAFDRDLTAKIREMIK